MNKVFLQIRKTSVSFIVATIIAFLTTNIVWAATINYIKDGTSNVTGYYYTTNPCITGWTCQDGTAYWDYAGGSPRLAWIYWKPNYLSTALRPLYFAPFIPNNGTTSSFGAIYYKVSDGRSGGEVFFTPVNQTNWKGSYVNLGFVSNGSNISYVLVDPVSQCVPGYTCNGTLKVYYDWMRTSY